MTIKVYMNDGRVEEYPNAHITWEWDEEEGTLGTNSGWRVHAIDRNCTTVSAFISPSECEKIEVTSEESDKVFQRPPDPIGTMLGKEYRLFSEINNECRRQDEKWGEQNHPMTGKLLTPVHLEDDNFPDVFMLKEWLDIFRHRCGTPQKGWFDILGEEVCEAFFETEPAKQREEMIQVAAVAVQIIKYLDRGAEQ